MEPSIFRFIWHYSKRQQLILLLITALSFPFLYFSLDLPKTIINQAIGGRDFPKVILGIELGQIQFLMMLCMLFLMLVLINGGFKLWINIYRGALGERMLRRLRYILFSRILRFPMPQFNKTSQGEIISMIVSEVEPLGGYIGESVSLPAFQGGTLITILAFIMVQDPFLGVAAIALYPVQMYVIPKLQKRVNMLAKQRVQSARRLSERIGESVSGIQEAHIHDTSAYERAHITSWLGRIYAIRYKIYKRKFFIKFLNNLLNQLTPFFFYSLGGVLVIKGNLSFGALVAVIAAYKDLAPPWNELLKHYQIAMDAKIKYEQLEEQFRPEGMLDEAHQLEPPATLTPLSGNFEASNVVVEDDTGYRVLDGLNVHFPLGGAVALMGAADSGRDELVRLLPRLAVPDQGTVRLGGHDAAGLHEAVIAASISYVDQNAYIFSGSIRDNILYGMHHRPVGDRAYEGAEAEIRAQFISEARQSGNSIDDLSADWIDFDHLGIAPEQINDFLHDILKLAGLEEDITEFGLKSRLDPAERPDIAERLLEARLQLRDRLQSPQYASLVETFDKSRFNENLSVGENILMGRPLNQHFDFSDLGANDYMLSVLKKTGMEDWFLETGLKVAETMVELFQDLPPGHEFFERFSFIESSELPDFQLILRKADGKGLGKLSAEEQARLRSLTFMLTPARHRLDLVNDEIRQKILGCRGEFAGGLPEDMRDAVEFYDETAYSATASVQENILFGKIAHGRARAQQAIGALISEIIEANDLGEIIFELGLDMQAGVAGGRLSAVQKQKLSLARSLVKKPATLVLNNPLSALDPASAERIMDDILAHRGDSGIVWVINDAQHAGKFDQVITLSKGRLESRRDTMAEGEEAS